jgi:hypothetical protein
MGRNTTVRAGEEGGALSHHPEPSQALTERLWGFAGPDINTAAKNTPQVRRLTSPQEPSTIYNGKLIILWIFDIKNSQDRLPLVRKNFNAMPDVALLGEIFKFFGLSPDKVIAEFFPRHLSFSRVFHHFSPF